jgi:hypothetical protein
LMIPPDSTPRSDGLDLWCVAERKKPDAWDDYASAENPSKAKQTRQCYGMVKFIQWFDKNYFRSGKPGMAVAFAPRKSALQAKARRSGANVRPSLLVPPALPTQL